MEYLIKFIGTREFYMLLLVVIFLVCKSLRIGGIVILMMGIFTKGEIPFWLLSIVVLITLFTNYLYPYRLFKHRYEKNIEEFYGKRRRAD